MRPVNYRAWDKKDKFYYWALTHIWFERGPQEVYKATFMGSDGSEMDILGKRLIFEQYTDVKDSKGRRIYEGDIVQMNPKVKFYRAVTFHKGEYFLAHKDSAWELACVYTSHPKAKVVGNIHENPELLKEDHGHKSS